MNLLNIYEFVSQFYVVLKDTLHQLEGILLRSDTENWNFVNKQWKILLVLVSICMLQIMKGVRTYWKMWVILHCLEWLPWKKLALPFTRSFLLIYNLYKHMIVP